MIYPTAEQISKLTGDRYLITVATAKCARMVTDEYVEQRAAAERLIAKKEADKPLFSMIDPDIRDDKAVKTGDPSADVGGIQDPHARGGGGTPSRRGERADGRRRKGGSGAGAGFTAGFACGRGSAGRSCGRGGAAGCAAGFACERAGNGGSGGRPVRGRAEGVI